MEKDVQYAAKEAVLGLQLSFDKAVNFVIRNAVTDRHTAQAAVKQVLVNYNLV